jgi:hypothetical protein
MRVISPATISLKSTNVAVNSEAEWAAATTYGVNDLVQVTTATPHKVYKSLRGNNLNRQPSDWLEPQVETSTSATSLTVGAVSQSLTVETGKLYSAGMIVNIKKTTTPASVWMLGEVTSYNSGTGALVVSVYSINGTGTHTDWTTTSQDEIGFWEETESTNQWAMFDEYVNTQTTNTTSIEIKLNTVNATGIALLGLDASSVEFELWDSTETTMLWSTTEDLVYGSATITTIGDWYEYFFGTYSLRTDISVEIGVSEQTGVLVVNVIGETGSEVGCGVIVVGRLLDIGSTQYGPKIGIVDYSYRSEDSDGKVTVTQGYWAKRNTITTSLSNTKVDDIYRALVAIRGIPTSWDGNNDGTGYGALVVYGIFSDFEITVPGPTRSYCTFTIEGLI